MNARYRGSSPQLFKNLNMLPLKSQYVFSLLLFVAKNTDLYELNSEIHNINTIFSSDLHTLTANLTFQKEPFYFGIKFFNYLPTNIEILAQCSHFKSKFLNHLICNITHILLFLI
jgi:hypothetical protein